MRYVLAGLIALAALLGAFAWIEHGRAETAQASAAKWEAEAERQHAALAKANSDAKLLRETSFARAQELTRLRQQSEAQQKALNDALQANPDWAAARIPASVRDALTGPAPAASQARSGLDAGSPRAAAPGRDQR